MDDFLEIAQSLGVEKETTLIAATGGGAYKFQSAFEDRLGIKLQPVDEMDALVRGFRFFHEVRAPARIEKHVILPSPGMECSQSDVPPHPPQYPSDALANETYRYDLSNPPSEEVIPWPHDEDETPQPALLVNIGSGAFDARTIRISVVMGDCILERAVVLCDKQCRNFPGQDSWEPIGTCERVQYRRCHVLGSLSAVDVLLFV